MSDEERWKPKERAQLEFELFKHLTTLSGVAVVALLALYEQLEFDTVILAVSEAIFAITLALSLVGTAVIINVQPRKRASGLLIIACSIFISGILAFVVNIIISFFPLWVGILAAVVAVLFTVLLYFRGTQIVGWFADFFFS